LLRAHSHLLKPFIGGPVAYQILPQRGQKAADFTLLAIIGGCDATPGGHLPATLHKKPQNHP